MNTEQARVGVTNLANVFESKIRENFAAIVGEIAPKKIEDVVRGLEEHFLKGPPEAMGQCDICHGWSPVDGLDACPYCDDRAEASEPEVHAAEIVDSSTSIDALAMEQAGHALFEATLRPADEKKRKKEELAERKRVSAAPSVPKPSTPVLPSLIAGGRPKATEKDLDDSLARYRTASEQGADSLYLMGIEIRKQRELWQQRMENGKPKYKSWNQFVAGEHDISTSLANRTMRVVDNFSQAQFHAYGAKALMVLVGAPKDEHAALLAQADAGATTRDLEEEVRKIRERDGISTIATGRTAQAAASGSKVPSAAATTAAASARKKEAAAITIGLKSETGTIKMLARKDAKKGEERAARTVEDLPYFVIEGINGVSIYVAIKLSPSGELSAKYTAKRAKDDDEE